jgi:sulfide dehydrogenase cytochrome subunit
MLSSNAFSKSLDENVAYCNDCHGKDGVSSDSDVPSIAGFASVTISDMLFAYADETRPKITSKFRHGDTSRAETDMVTVAKALSEEEIEEIAAFYSEKPFVAAKQEFDAKLAKKGAKIHENRCTKCHDEGGTLQDDESSILAGQWAPYLRDAFKYFRDGSREGDKEMIKAVNKLSDKQIEQLVQYYASQQ